MTVRKLWDPERYAANARFVAELGMPVVKLLAPQPGERILDLGCGDGVLTSELVRLGCEVVGVDSSAELVAEARRRGIDARVMDAEELRFAGEFDAVFSNAALHWMTRPDLVIRGSWRALRPGGRFVAELGGHGCIARIEAALTEALARRGIDGGAHNPWYFPIAEDYGARLRRAGFAVETIELFPRPTVLPGDLGEWLETFADPFLKAVPQRERGDLIAEVRIALEPELRAVDGSWTADYVRLRFAAIRPDSARDDSSRA